MTQAPSQQTNNSLNPNTLLKNSTGLVGVPSFINQLLNVSIGGASLFALYSLTACGGPKLSSKIQPAGNQDKPLVHYPMPGHTNAAHLAPPGAVYAPKKIIGDNDLIPVNEQGDNVPARFAGIVDAFGRMSMGCTATHIGQGFVLTAGHCFRASSFRENNISCDDVTVEWGVRENSPGYLVSRCEIILAQETSDDLDYAILKVTPTPRATVAVSARKASVGQPITIFGHPQQRPLEWSNSCELLSPSNGSWSEKSFSHQCDTEIGNSGSTVIDDRNAEIIGIHGGGIEPYNYGTHITDIPLQEYEAYYTGREAMPPPSEQEGTYIFGKLDLGHNRSDQLLVELEKNDSLVVNFTLTVDLEGANDFVIVEDATGRRSGRILGRESFGMTGMKAPVKVLFSSDSSGLSSLVKISKISFQ